MRSIGKRETFHNKKRDTIKDNKIKKLVKPSVISKFVIIENVAYEDNNIKSEKITKSVINESYSKKWL